MKLSVSGYRVEITYTYTAASVQYATHLVLLLDADQGPCANTVPCTAESLRRSLSYSRFLNGESEQHHPISLSQVVRLT